MARQECDYYDSVKTYTVTTTTNVAGTFNIGTGLPNDYRAIIGIVDTDIDSSYYIVQYNELTYGAFLYTTPHNPYNGSLTVKVKYI